MRTFASRSSRSPARALPAGSSFAPAHVETTVVRRTLHSPRPQAKLTVGAPGDAFEREADHVAAQVMRTPETVVQRMCTECEEEQVQAKEEDGMTPSLPGGFEQRFAALHGGGQPLPASERAFFEPRFGRDFANVRLHSGPVAGELAHSVHARAFTLGDSIVLGSGEYAAGTTSGRQLLAHELTHVVQQEAAGSDLVSRIQRAVSFRADFSNVSLTPESDAAVAGNRYNHDYATFSADAGITATGDSEAEIDQWDVGVLQDMIVNWEREYWRRDNADRRGRFVEQKFRRINTAFRDQEDGAATVWSADDEHEDLSAVAKNAVGPRFEASTTITTEDEPSGGETINGSDVTGMDATDGNANVNIERTGTRFDTFISAHNTVTDEWRHLRRLNWNYMKSLDFNNAAGAVTVRTEQPQVGHHGPYAAGRSAPQLGGTTANDAVSDDANWTRRRVNGWT